MSNDKKKIEFAVEMIEDIEAYLTRFDSVTAIMKVSESQSLKAS